MRLPTPLFCQGRLIHNCLFCVRRSKHPKQSDIQHIFGRLLAEEANYYLSHISPSSTFSHHVSSCISKTWFWTSINTKLAKKRKTNGSTSSRHCVRCSEMAEKAGFFLESTITSYPLRPPCHSSICSIHCSLLKLNRGFCCCGLYMRFFLLLLNQI